MNIKSISKTEFETEDGIVYQFPFELTEIPTLEEFQLIYDNWKQIFKEKGFVSK